MLFSSSLVRAWRRAGPKPRPAKRVVKDAGEQVSERSARPHAQDYHTNFRPNWSSRMLVASLVMVPNVLRFARLAEGRPKFG